MPMHNYYQGFQGVDTSAMTIWMVVLTIAALILAAAVVWALVRLARQASRGASMTSPAVQPSPADILKARYARGEIDDATFREMMARLSASDEAVAPAMPAKRV